jgi:3-methyladenine DNA glycosylase/8-oxoguanine DNA glycosylase
LDLDGAARHQLMRLPGIGPKRLECPRESVKIVP